MCGVDGDVMSTRYDELPRVRIVGDDGQRGTSARIPLFSEVLDRVGSNHVYLTLFPLPSGTVHTISHRTHASQ